MEKIYPSIERIMEVTAFKELDRAQSAIETLKWLDAGAPHKVDKLDKNLKFDMKNFSVHIYIASDEIDHCGTACCIGGAMENFRIGKGQIVKESIMRAFDIEEGNRSDPLVQLFFPLNSKGFIEQKTPDQAAETFRQYLFTGEVEWK